jgi:hypothetical protein
LDDGPSAEDALREANRESALDKWIRESKAKRALDDEPDAFLK